MVRMFPFGPGSRVCEVTALALLLCVGSACQAEKARADEIQRKAEETIAKLRSEAAEKIAGAQKKIDELENRLVDASAQAKTRAEGELSEAKSEQERLAAAASEALKKARDAYKESERTELAALLKDVDEIRAKAESAPPKVKTKVDKALKKIAPKKDAVKKNIDALDAVTLESLKAAKAKADKALASLRQAIASAHAKLK